MRLPFPLRALLPFTLLLGGCPIWGPHADGGGTTGPDVCLTDGDCALGEACEAGACVPTGTCVNDASCGAGRHCDFRGTCVDDVPGRCDADADCTGGTVCLEGACVTPGPSTCRFDLECAADQVCVNAACVNRCTSASACGSGQQCVGGRCEADPGECLTSDDCPGSEHCVAGRCLPSCSAASCADPDDVCADDDFCRPDPSPTAFCDADADCAAGSVCELSTGICRVPCHPTSGLVTGYVPSPGCSAATADCACQSSDIQFVACGLPSAADDYCRTQGELVADCTTSAECTAGAACVNGACE